MGFCFCGEEAQICVRSTRPFRRAPRQGLQAYPNLPNSVLILDTTPPRNSGKAPERLFGVSPGAEGQSSAVPGEGQGHLCTKRRKASSLELRLADLCVVRVIQGLLGAMQFKSRHAMSRDDMLCLGRCVTNKPGKLRLLRKFGSSRRTVEYWPVATERAARNGTRLVQWKLPQCHVEVWVLALRTTALLGSQAGSSNLRRTDL